MERKKKNKIIRYFFRTTVIFITLAIIILALLPYIPDERQPAKMFICGVNLKHFGAALQLYREQNKIWITHNNWCDAIKPYLACNDNQAYRCPFDKIGPCSYAMNKNIPADVNDLPPDLVLLFESAPGWNRTGGSDDVVTNRHNKTNKAYVVFADGHIEFVPADKIQALRWTMNAQPSASDSE
jgi:prepilin-type processing-associated H-X9-DG protein